MEIKGWKYYNHAAIPITPPYQNPNVLPVENGDIWSMEGYPLLVRYTTDFDCGFETNWWYVIKDTAFDLNSVKAKRRYEINKGSKYFDVKLIDPCAYKTELYCIQKAAFSVYPEKYRPQIDQETFVRDIDNWKKFIVFGAFFRETEELVGYALLSRATEQWIDFSVLKAHPQYEKYAINAAIVDKILRHFSDFLTDGGTICDGARNINHETRFQDYLEKYFGFRKAYCHLHIIYHPRIKWVIRMLYPCKKLLQYFDSVKIVHNLNAVIKMEEIVREKR